MLISHRKKFIYTKTYKTAGTSVESYFEPHCMGMGEWDQQHERDQYISEHGIIGARSKDTSHSEYYNHMSALEIKQKIGDEIWDAYFKFTVIRNPFSKLVSAWYHFKGPECTFKNALRTHLFNPGAVTSILIGKKDIVGFREWVAREKLPVDRDKYLIGGEVCVDYFIRFESLAEGIAEVHQKLGIPLPDFNLPKFKQGFRSSRFPISAFYDSQTEARVRELFAWEFDYFDYAMPV